MRVVAQAKMNVNRLKKNKRKSNENRMLYVIDLHNIFVLSAISVTEYPESELFIYLVYKSK